MHTLTKKEKLVLEGVKSFFIREGKMPTIRELQAEVKKRGLEVKSPRSIFLYLKSLEEKRFIKRTGGTRGIEIMDQNSKNLVDVPILGTANAGEPNIFAEENLEGYLKVSKKIVKDKDVFAIQIKGASMNLCKVNKKKIWDNDYVIVNLEDKDFRDEDKVLVVIGGVATVKLYKQLEKNKIGLFPMSTDKKHKPIYLSKDDEFMINGKVVDVFQNIDFDPEPQIEYVPIRF